MMTKVKTKATIKLDEQDQAIEWCHAHKDTKVPLEFEEQCNLIKWCHAHKDMRLRLIYSHTNGARMARGVANKLKASGAKAGIPDLFLPVPSGKYHGLYIELKRVKGSSTSLIQKKWLALLLNQGYQAIVCFGSEDAQAAIISYLAITNT